MPEEKPIAHRILDATEVLLRRHGVEKTNVVDVARAMGMSHGNIYRHFESKQALVSAVALRWLEAVVTPLQRIAEDRSKPAAERLERWFAKLREIKRRKVLDDPELFRLHHNVVKQTPEVVTEHVETLVSQLERIITDGIADGEFARGAKPAASARAFLLATAAFHHPALLMQGPAPSEEDAKTVLAVLLAGLKAGTGKSPGSRRAG